MSTHPWTSTKDAQSHYTNRAAKYDEMNGGWHIQLGKDFIEWLSPVQPGSTALDLACGTGLVTLPLAMAVGPSGRVIGVDITKAMLDQARSKPIPQDSASIDWVEHDIMDVADVPEVQQIMNEGGFDVIACCSAFVLLPSAFAAIKSWSRLLRPGGKLIIDVPTEDKTLQYIFTMDMRKALGLPAEFDREWIEGLHSLENVLLEAGLKVEKGWTTKSYLQPKLYDDGEKEKVWEEQVEKYKDLVKLEEARQEEAKKAFFGLWEKNLGKDRKFRDGHWLYVVIGRKE